MKAAAHRKAGSQRRRSCARLAQRRTPAHARSAMAAARDEHEHDVIADLKVGHALAHLLDHRRGLMAERHRHRTRPRAVVAERSEWQRPAAAIFTSTSPRPGAEVELGDFERLRLGVRGRQAGLAEDGGLDAHEDRGSRNRKPRCWARSAGGATGKSTPPRARPCAANVPAPHEAKPARGLVRAPPEPRPIPQTQNKFFQASPAS